MHKIKVFVSVIPFGQNDTTPKSILQKSGWEICYNPYQRKLTPQELAEMASDSDAIIASTEDITQLIDQSTRLKFISRVGIGLDNIPFQRCLDKNIQIHYTPDAVTVAVAEMVIGSLISLTRATFIANEEIRSALWQRHIGKSLGEMSIGILGYGRIGKAVTDRLLPFQPKEILIHDLLDYQKDIDEKNRCSKTDLRFVSMNEVLENADLITLHMPLNKQNHYLIRKNELDKMKQGAYLINYSRGKLINEVDLIEAMKENKLGGIALDVFEKEPYCGALTQFKNALLTAHMGSCSSHARKAMEHQAAEAVINFFNGGELPNLIPKEAYGQYDQ